MSLKNLVIGLLLALLLCACSDKGRMKIPSHATVEKIQEQFANEIQTVTKTVAAGEDLSKVSSLNEGLVAVINRGDQPGRPPQGGGEDILKRHVIKVQGTFSQRNGAGVARLSVDGIEGTYIIRTMGIEGTQYWLCFKDWK